MRYRVESPSTHNIILCISSSLLAHSASFTITPQKLVQRNFCKSRAGRVWEHCFPLASRRNHNLVLYAGLCAFYTLSPPLPPQIVVSAVDDFFCNCWVMRQSDWRQISKLYWGWKISCNFRRVLRESAFSLFMLYILFCYKLYPCIVLLTKNFFSASISIYLILVYPLFSLKTWN